jgi:hypothetical protein
MDGWVPLIAPREALIALAELRGHGSPLSRVLLAQLAFLVDRYVRRGAAMHLCAGTPGPSPPFSKAPSSMLGGL